MLRAPYPQKDSEEAKIYGSSAVLVDKGGWQADSSWILVLVSDANNRN